MFRKTDLYIWAIATRLKAVQLEAFMQQQAARLE
jgi:hypothetical protein